MKDEFGKTIIIGLDGCTLDVIKPWADLGILPNFSALLKEGAWGRLISTYPPLTMPAWISFSTGKNPGRFNIYGFLTFFDGSYDLKPNSYFQAREQVEIWDILNAHGLSCGVLNYPLMDRPVRLDGYCVPGFMAHEVSYRTYPESLKEELDRAAGRYELDARGSYIMDEEALIENCIRIINKRAAAIRYLLQEHPVDVFMGVFTMTDRVLHRLYNLYGPGCFSTEYPPENRLAELFQVLDEKMGDILNCLDESDLLFIMSDHGFGHADRGFYVNNWLIQQGFLKWKGEGKLYHLGITQKNVGRLMYKIGLYKYAQLWAPSFLRKIIPPGNNPAMGISIADVISEGMIDWGKTKAVAISNGPTVAVYFNTEDRPQGIVPLDKVGDLRTELSERIRNLFEGMDIEVHIRYPEDLYIGDEMRNTPDLNLDFSEDLVPSGSIKRDGDLFGPYPLQEHAMEGIFMARHPWIRAGRVPDMNILDITPTILHLYGIPIAEDIDGKVMMEIFEEKGPPRLREISREQNTTAKDIVEKKNISRVAKSLRERGL